MRDIISSQRFSSQKIWNPTVPHQIWEFVNFSSFFKCKVIFSRFSYTLNLSPVFSGVLIWKHFIFFPCTSFFFTSLYLPLTLILIFSHDRMLTLHQNMFPLKGFGKYFETCTRITASNDVFRFPPTYFNMIGFTHKKRSIRFSDLRMQPACHKFWFHVKIFSKNLKLKYILISTLPKTKVIVSIW